MLKVCTVSEAARTLGLSPTRVRWLADTGRLPVQLRIRSGLRLFAVEDIENLRRERQAAAAGAAVAFKR